MSTEFRVVYLSGGTGLFLRATSPTHQVWNKDTAAFEDFNAGNLSHYAMPLVEIGSLGEYRAAVPDGWPAGIYTILFHDPAISASPAGSALFGWTGTEETSLLQQQSYGDGHWQAAAVTLQPLTATVTSWHFDYRYLEAVQYSVIGPIDLTILDALEAPVDLSGLNICFVAYRERDGAYAFQIDNCLVTGDANNVVRVSQDDTNTQTAGKFRYVLRDLTNDRALLLGELNIICAADAR